MNISNFNSILVRLKDWFFQALNLALPLFQFHIGTIKRSRKQAMTDALKVFQFHIGTIKRADADADAS